MVLLGPVVCRLYYLIVVVASCCCCLTLLLPMQQRLPILSVHSFMMIPTQQSFHGRKHLSASTTTTQLFFFGGPKDDGSPGDYVCKDCGYVFTKGPAAWAALPDNYGCPPCGAPKRRFTKVTKGGGKKTAGSKDAAQPPPKKSWF